MNFLKVFSSQSVFLQSSQVLVEPWRVVVQQAKLVCEPHCSFQMFTAVLENAKELDKVCAEPSSCWIPPNPSHLTLRAGVLQSSEDFIQVSIDSCDKENKVQSIKNKGEEVST